MARLESCRQPATISEALALPRLTSTTIGMLCSSSPRPIALRTEFWLGLRPSVVTTSVAAGQEFLAHIHRLLEQAARVPAQIQDQPLHALPLQSS